MKNPLFRWFSISLGFLLAHAVALNVHSAEPGVIDTEIVIRQSLTLQGGKDAFGVAVGQGIKLHLDEVNASGGVNGRKVVIRVMDDEGKGPVAELNARKLLEDGVFMLFGSVGGAPTATVMKVANERKVPFFG